MEDQTLPHPGSLLVYNWGLSAGDSSLAFWAGGRPPGPGAQGSTHSSCPLLPWVESAGFPQPTVADFRMTLPEAEVNQPSQPPLSIFSLWGGKDYKFSIIFTQRPTPILALVSHSGFSLLPKPQTFTF